MKIIKSGTLPGFEDAGNFSVLITVGDGELTDSQKVNITVLNVEPVQIYPKVIDSSPTGSNVSINAVINVTFNKSMNHSTVERAFLISPQINGTFNWTNNTMTFIPESLGYNTTYNVTIMRIAEDLDGSHLQENYSWEFTTESEISVNRPPVLAPINDQIMHNGSTLRILISARDPDNDTLTLSAAGIPSFAAFKDNGDGTGSIQFTLCTGDTAIYPITITASDGSLSDSDRFNLTVKNINRAPVADDQAVATIENNAVNINLSAVDPDNDVLSFSIVTLPANGTLNGILPNLIYIPKVGFNGSDRFTFRVNDGLAESNIAAVSITVNASTQLIPDTIPPIIESITLYPANTTAGSTMNITVRASDNIDVVEVTANDTLLTKSRGLWQSSVKASSSPGNYTVTIRAKDAANNTAMASVSYKVVTSQGGVSVAIIPKITNVTNGTGLVLNIKINNTENIDDVFYVYMNNSAISASSRADTGWFNWTSTVVQVPSRREIIIPIRVDMPDKSICGISGTKTFRIYANSTKWRSSAYDTGGLRII